MPRKETPPGSDDDFDPAEIGKRRRNKEKRKLETKSQSDQRSKSTEHRKSETGTGISTPSKDQSNNASLPESAKSAMPSRTNKRLAENRNETTKPITSSSSKTDQKSRSKPRSRRSSRETSHRMPKVDKKHQAPKAPAEKKSWWKKLTGTSPPRSSPRPKAHARSSTHEKNESPTKPMPQLDKPSSSNTTHPNLSKFLSTSRAPRHLKSHHRSTSDIEFANRQVDFSRLPAGDMNEQMRWVHRQHQEIYAKTCPMSYPWSRIHGGFRCDGGSHYVSDYLLAEGKGGMLMVPIELVMQDRKDVILEAREKKRSTRGNALNGYRPGAGFQGFGSPGAQLDSGPQSSEPKNTHSRSTICKLEECDGVYYPDEKYGHLGILKYRGKVPMRNFHTLQYIVPNTDIFAGLPNVGKYYGLALDLRRKNEVEAGMMAFGGPKKLYEGY